MEPAATPLRGHATGSGEIAVEDVSCAIIDRQGRKVPLVDGCSFLAERAGSPCSSAPPAAARPR
jgi:hypothetical protein